MATPALSILVLDCTFDRTGRRSSFVYRFHTSPPWLSLRACCISNKKKSYYCCWTRRQYLISFTWGLGSSWDRIGDVGGDKSDRLRWGCCSWLNKVDFGEHGGEITESLGCFGCWWWWSLRKKDFNRWRLELEKLARRCFGRVAPWVLYRLVSPKECLCWKCAPLPLFIGAKKERRRKKKWKNDFKRRGFLEKGGGVWKFALVKHESRTSVGRSRKIYYEGRAKSNSNAIT